MYQSWKKTGSKPKITSSTIHLHSLLNHFSSLQWENIACVMMWWVDMSCHGSGWNHLEIFLAKKTVQCVTNEDSFPEEEDDDDCYTKPNNFDMRGAYTKEHLFGTKHDPIHLSRLDFNLRSTSFKIIGCFRGNPWTIWTFPFPTKRLLQSEENSTRQIYLLCGPLRITKDLGTNLPYLICHHCILGGGAHPTFSK